MLKCSAVRGLELAAELPPIHLEAEIDADRADRRTVAQTEPDAAAQLAEVEVGDALEHVAAVGEHRGAELPPDRHAQLGVHHQHARCRRAESRSG